MNRRNFKLTLPESAIRKMNREQYYSAMHWLRYAACKVHKAINWDKFHKHIANVMLHGHGIIDGRDFIV